MNQTLISEDEVIYNARKKKRVNNKKPAEKFDNISVKHIDPLNEAQRQFFFAFKEGYNIVADGSAGTGKTYLATYFALDQLFKKEIEQIIFVRSAVNIRSQGFLPGTQDEKEMVYTVPFKAIVNDLCENGTAWDVLFKKDAIKFMTTTYIRGITLRDCIVILDEFQNMDASEIESVLTRLGPNATIILSGDTRQNDLNRKREQSGHDWLIKLTERLPDYFDVVNFTKHDIVRSELCKAIISAIEEM